MRQNVTLMKNLLGGLVLIGALALPNWAQAANLKIAVDLQLAVSGGAGVDTSWSKGLDGKQFVKVLIASNSSDTSLRSLRSALLAQGGSVHYVYLSMRGLSGLVPVSALESLAARSDVIAITPNRMTARTGSLLQDASGSSAAHRFRSSNRLRNFAVRARLAKRNLLQLTPYPPLKRRGLNVERNVQSHAIAIYCLNDFSDPHA